MHASIPHVVWNDMPAEEDVVISFDFISTRAQRQKSGKRLVSSAS